MALAAESGQSDAGADIAANFSKNLEGDNDCNTYAACLAFLTDGETIHYRGASSAFDKWDTMEPGTGVYDVWAYNADGTNSNLDVPQIEIS